MQRSHLSGVPLPLSIPSFAPGDTVRCTQVTDHALEQQKASGVGLLWATQNLFSHPRFMNGGATNPNLDCYAYACAKTKMALDVGHKLGGENHVFWGGREGYQSILNTNGAISPVAREAVPKVVYRLLAVSHRSLRQQRRADSGRDDDGMTRECWLCARCSAQGAR
eukprot:COSAG01_NODE_9121_length_2545_cov_2.343418_4_plen_166_part_00